MLLLLLPLPLLLLLLPPPATAQIFEICMPLTNGCETTIVYMANRKKKMLDEELAAGTLTQTKYDVSFTSPGCDTPEMTVENISNPELYDIDRCTMNFWLEYATYKQQWVQVEVMVPLYPFGLVDPVTNSFFNRPSPLQYAAFFGAPWSTVYSLLTQGADKEHVCNNSKFPETSNEAGRAAPDFCSMNAANTAFQATHDELAEAIENWVIGDAYVPLEAAAQIVEEDEPAGYLWYFLLTLIGVIALLILFSVIYVQCKNGKTQKKTAAAQQQKLLKK